MSAPALPRPDLGADLDKALAEHDRCLTVAASLSNRPGEDAAWSDVRQAHQVVKHARAALNAQEGNQ